MNNEIYEFKVKNCLNCNTKTNPNDEEERFCSNCGAPVLNQCSNYSCQKILKADAKYCKFCGAPSIFNNFGLLEEKAPINTDIDDLPF